MNSSEHNYIPDRLLRQGRPVVSDFDSKEKLFLRFSKMEISDGVLYPTSIRFPEFSVNRELFSEPEDVLLSDYPKFKDWGISSVKVEDVPQHITSGEDTRNETHYEFRVEHDPLEDNYSHSEVRTYKNNRRASHVKNKLVKKRFRFKLSEKIIVLKEPLT